MYSFMPDVVLVSRDHQLDNNKKKNQDFIPGTAKEPFSRFCYAISLMISPKSTFSFFQSLIFNISATLNYTATLWTKTNMN